VELQIDAKQVLQQALNEVEPGEDIDEAILRACKALHPEQHALVFPVMIRMVEMMVERQGGSKTEVIRRIAGSEGGMSITVQSSTVTKQVFKCGRCGHTESNEFDRCPNCGKRTSGGLLGGLFAR